jgi:hypothetical protein
MHHAFLGIFNDPDLAQAEKRISVPSPTALWLPSFMAFAPDQRFDPGVAAARLGTRTRARPMRREAGGRTAWSRTR